ncbi:killer cell lectin-like receptor subfamily B member 1 isoform X2 [Peromyscus eremicus]|uniref:killer cell lectin-like receptor subfamily B member 1 isoform X2 n=1 Tax=Peromyscus eremicus TaxID=42410 RepID=UPI0027DB0BAE|nr:killer cell lectin-like receptor subfamily B member 1 isoform X2 [Peromyscus eremicus]
MDTSVVYADLNLARTQRFRRASPPSLHSDACRCPRWHRLALKLSCAGLILLVLSLTGLMQFLVQKPPREKCSVTAQENMAEPTRSSAVLTCPKDWHPYRDKCLFISQTSRTWTEGLADCSVKEATLLLIENEEELRFIQDISKKKGHQFSIGLNDVQVEKIWKWINGSSLNLQLLQITGKDKENSCAFISQTEVFSDICSSNNRWICQKKRKHV